jgi:hypothetical protein
MEEKLEKILLDLNIGYITVKVAKRKILRLFAVSGRSEQLVNFLLHLNDKELINNHDFDYEKEAKKYLKKIN